MSSAGILRSWEPDGLTALTAALDLLDPPDAAERARYLQDPAAWVGAKLGEHLWSTQVQILEAVRDHRRTAVRSAHGVGKSHTASRATGWFLACHPPGEAFVVTTAPTAKQVEAVLWRYIQQMGARAQVRGNPLPGRILTTEWKLGNELVAFGRKPADHDSEGFQGIHARYVLVILDEASGIPEQLWTAANALLTNDDCRILAIGNPADPNSHFAKVSRPGSGWHTIKVSAFDSPNFTGEAVPDDLRPFLVNKIYVDEMRRDLGEGSPKWSEKVLGEFPTDAEDQIVRTSDLAACQQNTDRKYTPAELLPIELGVDVAGSVNGDETVIRERRGRMAGREWRLRSDDTMAVVKLVMDCIEATGATSVKVDYQGVGQGVHNRLDELHREGKHHAMLPKVVVGGGASDPQVFLNLRAELWWMVGRKMAEDRLIDLQEAVYLEPGRRWQGGMENADVTISQLTSVKYVVNAQGRIQVEKKEDVISRIGRSPDNADAYLLAFYTPPGGARSYLEALLAEQRAS